MRILDLPFPIQEISMHCLDVFRIAPFDFFEDGLFCCWGCATLHGGLRDTGVEKGDHRETMPPTCLWLLFARPCLPIHGHESALFRPGSTEKSRINSTPLQRGARRARIMPSLWTIRPLLKDTACVGMAGARPDPRAVTDSSGRLCHVPCRLQKVFALKPLTLQDRLLHFVIRTTCRFLKS